MTADKTATPHLTDALPQECDAVVVGAGLAGLACALRLEANGLDVHVLEGSDGVGGRARTDLVDGFVLDRGFQVLNTAYPQVRRLLDLQALDLCPFTRGAVLHVEGSVVRLADPRREPGAALTVLRAPIGSLRDKAALGAYAASVSFFPSRLLHRSKDIPAERVWQRYGMSVRMVDDVLRPFFAGVLLETEMTTSGRFTNLMMRMLVRGDSTVPASGMQAMGEQLAARLPGRVHLHSRVDVVRPVGVDSAAGSVGARAVVVATGGDVAARLLPGVRPTAWKGVTTVYHAAAEPPCHEGILVIDAEDSPVNNTVVVTAVAPTRSGDGRALVATSLVHTGSVHPVDDSTLRAHLARLYRTSTSSWERVAEYSVPAALPRMDAPHEFRKPVRSGGAYVCGDHRDTSSIQGALVSGHRAADAVLQDLAAR